MARLFDVQCDNCGYKEADVLYRDDGSPYDDEDGCPACSQGKLQKVIGTFKTINMNHVGSSREGHAADGTKWKAELTPRRWKPGRGLS
jgi:hypothetical protein